MWVCTLLLLALCTIVHGNTEKLIFRANANNDLKCLHFEHDAQTLTPPYSTLQRIILPKNTSTNSQHWYILDQLQSDMSYELRISYPATSPSDFELTLHAVCDDNSKRLLLVEEEYAGVSNIPGMEQAPVTYDIVLENLYFGFLFYQVYKVAAAVAVVLLLGQCVLLPKIRKVIHDSIDLKRE